MPPSIQDVDNLSKSAWTNLPDSKKQEMLDIAGRLIDNQLSGKTSTVPELEGNRDDAHRYLTAHLWTLAEGGESGSESGTGGSVTYNTTTGEWQQSLSETRWGRLFRDLYLGNDQSTGIVRSY
jgi:hypothetical protein